ncbi:hypothetical protein Ddye_027779 [Dipteronia dyeriana]|uniref:Disease resistance N-terminal domain-containing protein n=1 Tax=Dipteronia dyeriana TaxID=168575 RepID=A0AAD9TPR6_9ROSI|nr:hypothetical protein Ddye_027779 [Dipteronia dyeriana]
MTVFEFSLDVGNALLSGFFQVFFDRLAPHHLPRFVREGEVRSELDKWRTTMAMIQAVLSDAEEKQIMNMAVKLWLDDVRDLVYDAEDILDECATKSLKRDLKEKEPASIVSTYLRNVSPSKIVFNNRTMAKINGITERLDDLCKKRSELGLMERIGGGTSTAVWRRPPSTCLPTETAVYGRDEDRAKLLELVSRDEPSDPNFRVISIVDQLPEALKRLEIEHCEKLTTIGQLHERLKRFVIKRLDRLSSAGQLPASLEHLSIDNCPITTLSSTGHLRASLQHLEILSCSKLTSLSSTGYLPASLQHLQIVSCSELTSVSSTGHLPASLQHLQIVSCSKLTRLSSGQLLPATLKYLNISSCGIISIADGLQNLYSLQELFMKDLTSLSSFPQEGFPINLTSLSIISLKIPDQVMQTLMPQLHKITYLRHLYIGGCQNAGMEMMLPTSLTHLTLSNFSKLERLFTDGYRNLASLEYLSISNCPKLRSFLKDLPSSLLALYISDCSKLTTYCRKGGRYWSNISNIPYVEIDEKYIYEPPPVI